MMLAQAKELRSLLRSQLWAESTERCCAKAQAGRAGGSTRDF